MNKTERNEAAKRGIAKALLSLDNDGARAILTGRSTYTLRSHEKLSRTQVGDGIQSFDVTYEILRDGTPLSFDEHMSVVRLLRANPLEALRDAVEEMDAWMLERTPTADDIDAMRSEFRAILAKV